MYMPKEPCFNTLWSSCHHLHFGYLQNAEMKQTWQLTLKTAEKAELHRICKVAESGWVGQSPNSCCFIPSRSKNSSGDQSGARPDAEIGRISSVFFGRASTLRRDEYYSSPSSGIKSKGGISPGSHWQLRALTAMHTAVQIYVSNKKNTQRHTIMQARKHAGCILCRPVQYKAGSFDHVRG